MSRIFQILETLSKTNFLSGMESTCVKKSIPSPFLELGASLDDVGNLWIEKRSDDPNAKNILIEAHLDAIGLCVKGYTDGGFLTVSACGGFDAKILPGTEFYVHSKKDYKAIATSIPPHLASKAEKSDVGIDKVYLDCGFSCKQEAEMNVELASPIRFAAPCKQMLNGCICAPSLDNKAAVIALLLAAAKAKSPHNLFFMFSMGEETTSRGVKTCNFPAHFDLALVVDAGFGFTKGLDPDRCILMHKGPSVSIADTLTASCASWVESIAKRENIPLQIVVEPGGTGTSATALQLRQGGIPCALISIPLKYMHTPSELVAEEDIEQTAALICRLTEQENLPFGEVKIVG